MRPTFLGLFVAAACTFCAATPAGAVLPAYQITDLGTLGGTNSNARGINVFGQVVGYSTTAGGATHAFIYAGGMMADLGTLGGTSSYAYGISDGGQIVGTSNTSANGGGAITHAHKRLDAFR